MNFLIILTTLIFWNRSFSFPENFFPIKLKFGKSTKLFQSIEQPLKVIKSFGSFHSLSQSENNLYIDKTSFFSKLIQNASEATMFYRPTRSGKSLFLSAFSDYLDISKKMNSSFSNLYIGKHPEEQIHMHDCYVLRLNFAISILAILLQILIKL